MNKKISNFQNLRIVRNRLEDKFKAKISKIGQDKIDNIIFDYNNFFNLYEEERCNNDIKSELIDLHINSFYDDMDFTKSKKEKMIDYNDKGLTLKQYFCKYYFNQYKNRCCFCGQILEKTLNSCNGNYLISTIEHLFPKSKFPQYTLCVDNWVPCCYECNINKRDTFFTDSPRKEFYDALVQLGIIDSFGKEPLQIWKNISFDFSKINGEILIKGKPEGPNNKKAFQLLCFYGLNNRYKAIQRSFYSNLFNLLKYHNICSPETMESFLENCQNANMQEMISDFSFNNYPKLWHDFIDYLLYDYNNLTALWEEIKEYNKLKYFKF